MPNNLFSNIVGRLIAILPIFFYSYSFFFFGTPIYKYFIGIEQRAFPVSSIWIYIINIIHTSCGVCEVFLLLSVEHQVANTQIKIDLCPRDKRRPRENCMRTKRNDEMSLTKCSTVFTTSRFDTWPTSIRPIKTANFRLSVIDILTTSSGRLISLYGGRVRSAIFTGFLLAFLRF